MKKILLVGATGNLGQEVAKALKKQGYYLVVVVRDESKLKTKNIPYDKCFTGDMNDYNLYMGAAHGVDIVISTLGKTKQKDKLTPMEVDYNINATLLQAAIANGVEQFVYVSVLHGEKLKELKICAAKERFVDELEKSPINSLVIRPSGFYSDMEEFIEMAKIGRVYLLGDGEYKANPIDTKDLAKIMVGTLDMQNTTLEIGGAQTITHNQIASLAFEALHKESKVCHIPLSLAKSLLCLLRLFTPQRFYAPYEFFVHVMSMDMVAKEYGELTLEEYFKGIIEPKE